MLFQVTLRSNWLKWRGPLGTISLSEFRKFGYEVCIPLAVGLDEIRVIILSTKSQKEVTFTYNGAHSYISTCGSYRLRIK